MLKNQPTNTEFSETSNIGRRSGRRRWRRRVGKTTDRPTPAQTFARKQTDGTNQPTNRTHESVHNDKVMTEHWVRAKALFGY